MSSPSAICSLEGRVAVVTGAAQGIGAATALLFARHGADLVICDKLAEPLSAVVAAIEALGRRVVWKHMDVRDQELVDGWVVDAATQFDRIDVVVNNAGGGFYAPFMDVTARGQAALMAENFGQVTSVIRGFVPHMTAGGSIVNITSIEGHRAGPGFGIYSAMKAAVENLSRTLALELADRRIRVNCIAPDMIPTPGDALLANASGAMAGDGPASVADSPMTMADAPMTMADAIAASALYAQPWPDGGSPEDCAAAALFLASDMSRFVTGSTIHVDGGTMAASGWKRSADGTGWRL